MSGSLEWTKRDIICPNCNNEITVNVCEDWTDGVFNVSPLDGECCSICGTEITYEIFYFTEILDKSSDIEENDI